MKILFPEPDSTSIPYGTLDFYQIHFIVDCGSASVDRFLAKCEPVSKGWFDEKKIIDVKWIGASTFVEALQADVELTNMLKEVLSFEGEIKVDPVNNNKVRIYGKWHNEYQTTFNQTLAAVADRIAMHIKKTIAGVNAQH